MLPICGVFMKIFSFKFFVIFSFLFFRSWKKWKGKSISQTSNFMSSNINSSFLYRNVSDGEMGFGVSRHVEWKNYETKIEFFSKIEQKSEWSNERFKTNGNKFRISHITISFKWVFYCFDFILLEYFIGSTRSSP